MRNLLFLLISCIVFANVASASSICCIDMDKTQDSQTIEMPCHSILGSDTADDTSSPVPDDQHQCQNCFQLGNLFSGFPTSNVTPTAIQNTYTNNFVSLDPGTIYYPPRQYA